MGRPKKILGYAIAVLHDDGVVGYLTDENTNVKLYNSEHEAAQALEEKKRVETKYTWAIPMEVRPYYNEKKPDD